MPFIKQNLRRTPDILQILHLLSESYFFIPLTTDKYNEQNEIWSQSSN